MLLSFLLLTFYKSKSKSSDILPFNGIPKFVIANEEDVAAAWPLALLLIAGICVIAFDTVVIVRSVTF